MYQHAGPCQVLRARRLRGAGKREAPPCPEQTAAEGNSFCSQTLGSELGSTQKWMSPYRNIKSEDGPFPERRQASLPDSTETWGSQGYVIL